MPGFFYSTLLWDNFHHLQGIALPFIEFKCDFVHNIANQVQTSASFLHIFQGNIAYVIHHTIRIKCLAFIMKNNDHFLRRLIDCQINCAFVLIAISVFKNIGVGLIHGQLKSIAFRFR
jgi:hypothetical protein